MEQLELKRQYTIDELMSYEFRQSMKADPDEYMNVIEQYRELLKFYNLKLIFDWNGYESMTSSS